jgi:hypothetical protein
MNLSKHYLVFVEPIYIYIYIYICITAFMFLLWVLSSVNVIHLRLGRPRRRWEDNIKMDLQEMGWGGGMDWIDIAQDRDRWRAVVSAVMNLRVA